MTTRRAHSLRDAWLPVGAIAVALASGCTTLPSIEVPREVRVPVAAPCVDPAARPKPPAIRRDEDLLAMDAYRRTLATWAERQALRAYAGEAEAVIEGCSRIPAGSRPP